MGFNEDARPQDVTESILLADRSAGNDSSEAVVKVDRQSPRLATINLPGLTNPDRVLFPEDRFTKADVAAYLYQVNQWMLPHLQHRPVSLLRCSDEITGETFFQRHPGKGFPPQIGTIEIDSEDQPLLSINDLSGLLATAQISAIKLHPWGSTAADIEHPDRMIIDLDPDEALARKVVVEAALIVRAELQRRNLQSYVKTTGGKGLHLVVPLSDKPDWDTVFEFSKSLAGDLAKSQKNLFVANMSKSRRKDRIFVDYHRNRRGSTAIAAYSLRARPGAPVSTPITWDELAKIQSAQFTLRTVADRLERIKTDPWAGIDSLKQRFSAVTG